MLRSAIYRGTVRHARLTPRRHAFDYPIFMTLLDLDEIDAVFGRSPLWSIDRFNLVSFRRGDYLRGEARLKDEVVRRIAEHGGGDFSGRVFVLTHLRYLGFCFNPVTFYFCCQADGRPAFILAEINNTPWNERHCYVLDCSGAGAGDLSFRFRKRFHVSPFMPMDLEYFWRFRLHEDEIAIDMALHRGGSTCFHAGLDLSSEPLSAAAMRNVPLRYPFITLAVVFRIYWQALRLWLKGVPFHDHPKHNATMEARRI